MPEINTHVSANFTAYELKKIIERVEFGVCMKASAKLMRGDLFTPPTELMNTDRKITLNELQEYVRLVKDHVAESKINPKIRWDSESSKALSLKIATAWKDDKTLEEDFKYIAKQNDDDWGQELMSNTDVEKLVESNIIKK
jgi:hypothetical protein